MAFIKAAVICDATTITAPLRSPLGYPGDGINMRGDGVNTRGAYSAGCTSAWHIHSGNCEHPPADRHGLAKASLWEEAFALMAKLGSEDDFGPAPPGAETLITRPCKLTGLDLETPEVIGDPEANTTRRGATAITSTD